jgi:septal ring factor EnvC (AmiA/AmiB activator)
MLRRALPLVTLLVAIPAPAPTADARPEATEVEALRAKLLRLGADQASGEGQAIGARARLQALNAEETRLTADIAANRLQLTRLLSALQLMTREPPPALLVSPRRANDAIRAAILMRAVEPALQGRAAALAAQAREIARLRREAALQGERLFLTESELADRRTAIEKLTREKGSLEQSLDPLAADTARGARDAARGAADPDALLRGLAARGADPSPGQGEPQTAPPAPDGDDRPTRLILPVTGQLAQRFGQRATGRRRSEGVAWRTEPQAQVRAPAGGRIDYAGPLKGWGQVIVLRLSDRIRIVLTGLARADTATGRTVAAGEPIGLTGQARAPAPELYLEVRRDGAPIDPKPWLDARPGA